MPFSRWLPCVAVFLGLGPPTAELEQGEKRGTETPYLDAALSTALWLDGLSVETQHGRSWPVSGERTPASTDLSLYAGFPGVVLFLLELAATTGDEGVLERARAGADQLLVDLEAQTETLPAGLYTGLAGLGFTLTEVWRETADERYRAGAERCLELLTERAQESEEGARWNDSTDIISGNAGIGLFLLYAARELERPNAVRLAARAGDDLLARAIPEGDGRGGWKWAMTPDFARRMPNFSHGTAGVGHFLVALYDATGTDRYLEGARQAARYLDRVAAPQEAGGKLVLHHEPAKEDLYYLGWCHGPPGTARFFLSLESTTGEARFGQQADELVVGLVSLGVPARSPGFWNNVGVCCGNAGVADFLFALDTLEPDGAPQHAALARSLLADLLERGTVDEAGTRWRHAEHRVRPELLSEQTGYMQGAAGIGLVLLRAHAHENGRTTRVWLPDEPWPQLVAGR